MSVINQKQISEILEPLRKQGKKIIMTNGCFDILHVGHSRYLNESKKLGDVLVVALNSDQSTKALKGDSRPINKQDDRAELLAQLKPVDYVVIFDELDACNIMNIIKPDIYTKGGDYTESELEKWPEYQTAKSIAAKIEIINFVAGKSSTNIINKSAEGSQV